ncbi:sigma 54-interacting transcriptional regulator [Clostridium sp. UBA4548]|uniref:sigma 54-interacting transcriptional regulator n=1 Tax=Clostridium sp. UBA4548 TaxID=1946361 RepID=UPI0025C3D446|nr:sigma 54-interacting transcriptional regulator [Clostridium sp. UBA4548]
MDGILREILDNISEGVIIIDTEGIITVYNKRAREIFGILKNDEIFHQGGQIRQGDYVFIVDNKLGKDDGNLNRKDLRKIQIYDETICEGDSVLCFGVYNTKKTYGQDSQKFKKNLKLKREKEYNYKVVKEENQKGQVVLKGTYKGVAYELQINYTEKILNIKINCTNYRTKYKSGMGHMVIIRDGSLLFYQSGGYTARNETIKQVLEEGTFREKGKSAMVFEPIGKQIFEVHEKSKEILEFYKAATANHIVDENKFMEINGITTISSIRTLYHGGRKIGAMIRVEDISELKKVTEERNILIENLKKTELLLEDKKVLEVFKEFVGVSKHSINIKKLAYKASKTNSSILILGESGTGKTTLAKEIHNLSNRKEYAMVHLNCASLPEGLLESELFGYEGGAFTNSKKEGKMGLLQLSHKGTLFLDEIGDMTLQTQGKILNFLQSKKFYKVGGTEEIYVDTRIICATNKNLEKAIEEGNFREDLYYRINIIPIYIEAIRNRIEDIPILVNVLLQRIVEKLGRESVTITSEAMNKLMTYPWYGNIRELENILERAITLSDSNIIYSKNLLFPSDRMLNKPICTTLKGNLEEYEKDIIIRTLRSNNGNIRVVLNELGIGKTSFYEKLKKYNIKLHE